jgi:hypothetical protein
MLALLTLKSFGISICQQNLRQCIFVNISLNNFKQFPEKGKWILFPAAYISCSKKLKDKFVPVFALMEYGVSGRIDPLILNLGARWREWCDPRLGRFNPCERARDIHCIVGCLHHCDHEDGGTCFSLNISILLPGYSKSQPKRLGNTHKRHTFCGSLSS